MSLSQDQIVGRAERVGIGDYALGDPGASVRITLGSCVGICLVWARRSKFAVAHVLLPTQKNVNLHPQLSRFADSVIPFLLEELEATGHRRQITAFAAGGGSMYAETSSKAGVGELNANALEGALKENKIRLVKSDFGAETPRQLVVDGPSRQIISLNLDTPEESVIWPFPTLFGSTEAA